VRASAARRDLAALQAQAEVGTKFTVIARSRIATSISASLVGRDCFASLA